MRVDTWRFTEWVAFDYNTSTPNWSVLYGRELTYFDTDFAEYVDLDDFADFTSLSKRKPSSCGPRR